MPKQIHTKEKVYRVDYLFECPDSFWKTSKSGIKTIKDSLCVASRHFRTVKEAEDFAKEVNETQRVVNMIWVYDDEVEGILLPYKDYEEKYLKMPR